MSSGPAGELRLVVLLLPHLLSGLEDVFAEISELCISMLNNNIETLDNTPASEELISELKPRGKDLGRNQAVLPHDLFSLRRQ